MRLGGVALPSHRSLLEAVGAPVGKVRVTYSPGSGGPSQSREITTGVGEGWDASTVILTHSSGASGTAESLWGTHSRGYRIPDVHCLRHADAHASCFVSRRGDYAPYRWSLHCPTCGTLKAAYEGRRKGEAPPEVEGGPVFGFQRPASAPPVVVPAGPTFEAQVEEALQVEREDDARREALGAAQLTRVWESYSEDYDGSAPRGARRVTPWSERTSAPFDPLALDGNDFPDGMSDAEKMAETEKHAVHVRIAQAASAHADQAWRDLSLETLLGIRELDDLFDDIDQEAYDGLAKSNNGVSDQPKVALEAELNPDFSALIYERSYTTTIYTSAEKTPQSDGYNSTLEVSERGGIFPGGAPPLWTTPRWKKRAIVLLGPSLSRTACIP